MFIHLPLIHFAPPPRLLIDIKNSKWLTYSCILLCICYCFSHLIGLLSVTWSSLLYKFTRFSIYFLFPSDKGPVLETLDYTFRIGSTPTFLYFDLYLHSAYAAHHVYFNYSIYVVIPISEQFTIENTQSATDDGSRSGACLYSPSKNNGALLRLTACNEEDERQMFSYNFKGLLVVCAVYRNFLLLSNSNQWNIQRMFSY